MKSLPNPDDTESPLLAREQPLALPVDEEATPEKQKSSLSDPDIGAWIAYVT